MLWATWRKSAKIGSINGEWKAWETVRGRLLIPSAANWAASANTVVRLPAITTLAGPFTAAIETSA